MIEEEYDDYYNYSLYFRYWPKTVSLIPIPDYDFEQPVQLSIEVTTPAGTVYSYNVDLTISQADKAYVINDTILVDKNNNIFGSLEIKPNLVTDIVANPTVDWVSANSFAWNPDNNSVELLSITKNNSTVSRTTTVPIIFNRGDYTPMQATLTINQEAEIVSRYNKAFEDIYFESDIEDSIEVYTDYNTLYEGTIVSRINLNEFVPQMFIDKSRIIDNSFIDLNLTKWIYVDTSNRGAEYLVTYDYSYDIANHLNITEVVQPIDYYDPRQLVFESIFNYDSAFNNMKVNNRSYINLEQYHKYNMTLSGNEPTIKFTYNIGPVLYNGKTFKQKCTNANYAVYYMNAYGGWNWMLFEGNKQVKSYSNTFSSVVGLNGVNEVYKVETKTNYDLTSLFLTDEGAKKLAQLYKSQIVYLHDFDTDSIIEVKVVTNTYTEKTYINQGRKYFTQSITLTEVKNKMIY